MPKPASPSRDTEVIDMRDIDMRDVEPVTALVSRPSGHEELMPAEQILSSKRFTKYMPIKQPIAGAFIGYGGVEIVDDERERMPEGHPLAGKAVQRVLHTWLIRPLASDGRPSTKITLRVPSAAQLDRQLPRFPKGETIVIRPEGKVTSRKGNQVNDYTISDPDTAWLATPHTSLPFLSGTKLHELAPNWEARLPPVEK